MSDSRSYESVSTAYGPASGLSNQQIYAIEEDTCGQIWFGTFRGLNRFDSRDFYQYFTSGSDSMSIQHNQVRALISDRLGRMWIGTVDGLCRYTRDDNFERHPQLNTGMVLQLEQGRDSIIYINVNNSLKALHTGPDSIETLIENIGMADTFSPKLLVDSIGDLWIAGRGALLRYNLDSRQITDSIVTPVAVKNAEVLGGEIWLSADPEDCVFNIRTLSFSGLPSVLKDHPLFGKADFTQICSYGVDSWLIQTASDGIFIYDSGKNELIHQDDNDFPFKAPDFKISTIFVDSGSNIWFGGVDQGFETLYRYMDRFNNDNRLRSMLEGKSVVSVDYAPDGNLWIATRSYGLFVYDSRDGSIRNIMPHELIGKIPGKDVFINYVLCSRDGNIWLSLTHNMILKCSYSKKDGLRLLNRCYVWSPMELAEDLKGTVWAGTASPFVFYIGKDDNEFKNMQVFDGYCFIPTIKQIDNRRMLVAGFNQPMKTIDLETGEISLLPVATPLDSVIDGVFIPTDILPEDDGSLWIGTVSNGLLYYNAASQEISKIDGVACTDVSAIEKDYKGNLWISTLYGLSHYDTASGKFSHFFDFDGIGGNQFYDRASASLPLKDLLLFGGTHGVTSFDPENVTKHIEAPLMFQNLKVHNDIVKPGEFSPIRNSLSLKPEITLNNNQNTFSISFVAVDFCENPRVTYNYMLEGVDQSWVKCSQNHEASYTNVPAGKYRFKVRLADDTDGSGEISLPVTVLPSPWLSWWAILIYVIAGVAVAGVCFYFYMNIRAERRARKRALREREQERRINDMNMRFFANVSHEFRTPLTMISGPIKQLVASSEISGDNRQLLSIAQTNVDRMLNLVNQLLDFNKLENDTLRLEVAQTDVAALLRDVTMSFALAAKYKQIDFRTFGLEDSFMAWVDADKVLKIYCNLLSNALKFTPSGGVIRVEFDIVGSAATRRMILKVENTGRRIPSDKLEKIFRRYYQLEGPGADHPTAGSGIGLYFARALATIHHGTLCAMQPEFEGVCFVLDIPADDVYSDTEHRQDPVQLDRYPIGDSVSPQICHDDNNDGLDIILVVDDDIQVANYIRVLLASAYKVVTMYDAAEALRWLAENSPALIISDVVMPGIDGYEFCRRIKSDLDLCHIPVLLVTAKASVENQVEGFNAEANAYITKPFEPALLMSLIGSLLRNRDKAWQLATTSTSVEGVESEILAPQDSAFLSELYQLMENELSNSELDVSNISRLMRMSRTKFYYKVKGLTGETPAVFFRTYKLNRATELIAERKYTLSEIADRTGFSTLSHFSRSFKKQFGVSPSEYQ